MLHPRLAVLSLALLSPAVGEPAAPTLPMPAAEPGVVYWVDLSRAGSQLVTIRMQIPTWNEPTLEVHMPVWRPGRYEVLDLAGGVREFSAADVAGAPLRWEKTAKSSWRVETPMPGSVTLTYEIYCNALGNRTRHADDTHAFLSGAGVFMYCDPLRHAAARVDVDLPAGWRLASGLAGDPARPGSLMAPDYDTLVDSPIEAGVHELRTFEVDGVRYEMASWGRTDALPESLEKDTAKIAKVQQDLFGSFPFDRYVFISHIAPGASGGTEHLNSTVIQFKPTVATEAKDYRSLLALVSHELFHTWNVKQFRPAGIKPYDYLRENYTPLLWIAEGTTSYYDELTCVRAGVWEVKHYLESLGKVADAELRRPGGRVQSLESSSFDSWIKFNRPSPDSVNSTVSFYSKGALVSLMLDARMRETTGGARTLDDLMRALYKRFPLSGPGYTSDDVLALLTELTGEDFEPFFARYVRGTEPLALEEALAWFGLETHRDAGEEKGDGPRAYLGLDLKDDGGLAAVTAVREDGPAHGAGVLPDDQIVAMDGLRLRAGDLDARLKGRTPGESVELTLLRRDQLRTVRLSLGESPRGALKVRRVEKATERQRAQYESWLGQPWPGKDGATDGSQAGGKEGAKDARP